MARLLRIWRSVALLDIFVFCIWRTPLFVFCICIIYKCKIQILYGFSTGLSLNRGSLRQQLMKKKPRRKIEIGNRMMRGGPQRLEYQTIFFGLRSRVTAIVLIKTGSLGL